MAAASTAAGEAPVATPEAALGSAATPPVVPARLSTSTVLEVRPLDSESPPDQPLQYHWPLALFTTEHVPGLAAWAGDPVDLSEAAAEAPTTTEHVAAAASPMWRVSFVEDAIAASLDDEVEATRLRLVKLRKPSAPSGTRP